MRERCDQIPLIQRNLSKHGVISLIKRFNMYIRLTRRDMESYWGRYWRYENNFITLYPVDESNPRSGGKVKVTSMVMDWHTFTPQYKTLYGVYTDDFITYGEFSKEAGNPFDDEAVLLKIVDENDKTTVPDKTTFKFENSKVTYKREVNGDLKDVEVDHPIKESAIQPLLDNTWSETLFYGVGNKSI